jgi:hypothetical protein
MYLKVKYPLEFCTAYLNKVNDSDGSKKKQMIKEIMRLKIPLKEANVNFSGKEFKIHRGSILVGLSDIKNVGEKAVDTIIENQPYEDLADFLFKVNSRACNKRSVENLIKANAFSDFKYNTKKLLDIFEDIHKESKKKTPKSQERIRELIESCVGGDDLSNQEKAELKQSVTPVSVGKHIISYYSDVLTELGSHIKITKLVDVELEDAEKEQAKKRKIQTISVAGLLTSVDLKRLSQEVKDMIAGEEEKRYALANLEDDTDFIVMSFKEDVYYKYEQNLYEWIGKTMVVTGDVIVGTKKLYVKEVALLEDLRAYMNSQFVPYNVDYDHFFRHPLIRWIKNGKAFREKYGIKPLSELLNYKNFKSSLKVVGIVTGIKEMTIKKEGNNKGKKFYNITFEDETFVSNFMLWHSDNRLKELLELFRESKANKMPFIINSLYRDENYDKSMGTGATSASLGGDIPFSKLIKKFAIKKKDK